MRQQLAALLCTLAVVLTSCAGVPNGSAPQAIAMWVHTRAEMSVSLQVPPQ